MKNNIKQNVKNKSRYTHRLFGTPLIIYLETERDNARKIRDILNRHGIKANLLDRRRRDILCRKNLCNRYSLIITVGGDGTFLRTAQLIPSVPILGVNSSPDTKEGFLTSMSINAFAGKIKSLINGIFKVDELPLIKVRVNNKELEERAVNEIFIGAGKSYRTAKYELVVNGRKDLQLSSGLIVSTATGTNSWFKSAGGRAMKNKNKLYFIVREPYSGRVYKPRLTHGSLTKTDLMYIKPLTPMILVFDSLSKEYKLREGDKISVKLDNKRLKRILI